MNEYLYEYEGNSEKKAGWYRTESAKLARAVGPVAAVMTVEAKPNGMTSLRQQVILYTNLKRIDFINDLDKAPSGRTFQDYKKGNNVGKESVYFAMPLNVPRFKIQHELAGAVVEPIADQSAGSTTSFYGIQNFTDLSNDQFGVTVGTVECGLVEYGTPRHSGTMRNESILEKSRAEPCLSLSNEQLVHDQHPGGSAWRSLSIDLRTAQPHWRLAAGGGFPVWGRRVPSLDGAPGEWNQKGTLPPNGSAFLELDQPNVAVSTFKPAEANGKGLILRLNEMMGRETKVTISCPSSSRLPLPLKPPCWKWTVPCHFLLRQGTGYSFPSLPMASKPCALSAVDRRRKFRGSPCDQLQICVLSWLGRRQDPTQ